MMRTVVLLGLLVGASAAFGQTAALQVIYLKWADAELVAAMFSDQGPPTPAELTECRQRWVNNFADKLMRALPRSPQPADSHWYYASNIVSAPLEQVRGQGAGSMSRLLPEGLVGPPTVLPGQNALLVRGTPAAIDQLRELVKMLDVKPRMVNVEVRLQDAPSTQTDEWGIDASARVGDLLLATRGNAPAGGFQVRDREGNVAVAAGRDHLASSGNALTAANITTTNNFPAILSFGRILPIFSSSVSYGPTGDRIVQHTVEGVFIGTELFVQPRINNNDTVTMLLRPTFIEAVGAVMGPDGTSLPITETVGTETQVTVPDGETLQIGGFERSLQDLNTRFAGFARERNVSVQSHPNLFVTPRIIRDVE